MRNILISFLLILNFSCAKRCKNCNTTLVQSIKISGTKPNLIYGGYGKVISVGDFLNHVRHSNNINETENPDFIGLGTTCALGDEMTYNGNKITKIFADNHNKISQKTMHLDEFISFAQVSVFNAQNIQRFFLKSIVNSNKLNSQNVHEINKNGIFKQIISFVANLEGLKNEPENSYIIRINAKAKYLKVRAVHSKIKETGGKIDILSHVVEEKNFSKETEIIFSGIITGTNDVEAKILQGLHLHCEYGHVLDLGDLEDVQIELQKIDKKIILY